MKRTLLIAFVLLFQISFSKPITETQKLAATCKVWGFLKYYHPNVTDGSKNWDEQLFQILPKIEEAQTSEAFSQVIENWIVSLGEIKKQENVKTKKEYFDKNFDLSWFNKNEFFSKSLSKKLKFIEENRILNRQFYYTSRPYIEVINEVKYKEFKWTDKNMRLLALFRYWNQIEYFFPYKYKMDQNWDSVLIEMMPRFSTPESENDFALAMREISIKLNDTHSSTVMKQMYDYFGDKFIAADVAFIDNKAVVTAFKNDSLAKIDDIRIGDVITKVDGKTVQDLINENLKYAEGSNEPAILKNIYWVVFNGKTGSIDIEFIRDNNTSVKTIKRYKYSQLKIKFSKSNNKKWKFLENNIGYVDIESIKADELPDVMDQFKNAKAIIFDARKYPQEPNIEEDIAQYLYPEEKAFAKFIDADLTYPGRYVWREDQKTGKTNPDYYKGKVIILENEKTQSHGEHLVMCLQAAPNAVVIGSQTAGADGGVCKYEIIKGYSTIFTGFGIFYPNGKETQRIGIVPDIEVKPTIVGIQQGKDEVLDRAILFAENGK